MKILKSFGTSRCSEAEAFLKSIDDQELNSDVQYEPLLKEWVERCNQLDRETRFAFCILVIEECLSIERKEKRVTSFMTGWYRQGVKYDLVSKSITKVKPSPNESYELLVGLSQAQREYRLTTAFRALIRYVVKHWEQSKEHPKLHEAVLTLEEQLRSHPDKDNRKLAVHMNEQIHGEAFVPIEPGEAWSDAVLAELNTDLEGYADAYRRMLMHASSASGSKPSKKWLKQSETLIDELGEGAFIQAMARWFSLVAKPRTAPSPRQDWRSGAMGDLLITDQNSEILKGLCWFSSVLENDDLARLLGSLAIECYKKIPGIGPRAVKIGNAAVYALGAMPGKAAIGQLAILRIKLKFASAQKLILKALDRVAEREGIPRDQIEEMSVPSYGLDKVGFGEEQLGEYTARLIVSSSGNTSPCKLVWVNPKGKEVKSVPAAIKEQFPDELKELKASVKDINKMLPVQRDRIDGMFLERRSWDLQTWRQRYLDHPLIGTIGRRLIWVFTSGENQTAAAWLAHDPKDAVHANGRLVRVDGSSFEPESGSTVSIWHPIHENAQPGEDPVRGDLIDWRRFYEERGIVQPFKQAHREVYLLTDAERRTEVYSNRFAAHVIRQHQFNALAIGRFWKNQLRIMADMECHAPRRDLQAWGIRAEFWVEGIGDNYGEADVSPTGAFLYLATDQVRFYAIEAAQNMGHAYGGQYNNRGADEDLNQPIPLEQIPPIVLSETLRDVDLFVGVASVGNNPEWADGGPEGRFQDYWHSYSFGTLSGTAQTRKELLGRLVPRLKIASQCELKDKFLIVRGNIRTYKIHLGSGNILMEPNDQYLCIVPTSAMSKVPGGGKVHLPFEGDRVLAIILSKAFMLADDHKITDKTILTQINR